MTRACCFLGISRQAYYKQCVAAQKREQQAHQVLAFVQRERLLQPRIGTRKLHWLINTTTDCCIGRDRLFDLLRTHRMLVPCRRAYHNTTQSHHRFHCHPNLLKPGENRISPNGPEQVWVADITYLPVRKGEAYLSLVTDAYSRKIVGYHVDDNLKAASVAQAYRNALRQRQRAGQLIHHSDRGIQYCSALYQAEHQKHGVKCSMTDGYDCYQNALAERVNGILKNEFLLHKPTDLEQARKLVEESIRIYNQRRPHMALKYKTPDAVHQAF